MVVFRLRGDNELTEKVIASVLPLIFCTISIAYVAFQLLKRLNHRGRLHAVPASLKGKYVIRFTVTSTHTTSDDIIKDWNEIRSVASDILEESNAKIDKRVPLKGKIEIFTINLAQILKDELRGIVFFPSTLIIKFNHSFTYLTTHLLVRIINY